MAIPAQQKPSTKPDDPSTDNHNPGHGDPPPAPKVTQRSICPATHSPPGRELPGAVSSTLLPERATCWPAEDELDRAGHPGRSQQLFFGHEQASLLVTSLLPRLT